MPKKPSPPSGKHRFARVNDAATYVDLHPVTIRKWIEDGKIRGYRSGQRVLRVDLDEIDAYLAGEDTGTATPPKGGRAK